VPAVGTYRLRREVNCSSERRQEHSTAHRRGRLTSSATRVKSPATRFVFIIALLWAMSWRVGSNRAVDP
jgi:hypothetical protein